MKRIIDRKQKRSISPNVRKLTKVRHSKSDIAFNIQGSSKRKGILNDEDIDDDDEESILSSDNDASHKNDLKNDRSEPSTVESVEQIRLRAAKQYLSRIDFEPTDSDDDSSDDAAKSAIDENRLSEKLRVKRLKDQGEFFHDLTEHFSTVGKNVESNGLSPSIELRGHSGPVTCVALSGDEQSVFSGSKDNSIIKWDLSHYATGGSTKGNSRFDIKSRWSRSDSGLRQSHDGEVLALTVSSDGHFLASGGRDKVIRIFDVRLKCAEIHSFSGHKGAVTSLSFQRNSHNLFSGSSDCCLKHWSVADMAYIETLFGHQDAICAVDCWNKERPISCSGDRTARLWKIQEETHLLFKGHKASIDCVQLLDSSTFVTGSQDGSLNLWKTSQKHAVKTVTAAHGGKSSAFGVTPHWISCLSAIKMSNIVASGSCDGFVRIWGADVDGRKLNQFAAIPISGCVNSSVLTPSLLIAGTGTEHRLGRWQTSLGGGNKIIVYRLPHGRTSSF